MKDYIDLGPTPCDEDCAQVGSPTYKQDSNKETWRYLNGLLKFFGEPPGEAFFYIKSNPHDFGSYSSVVIYFHPDNKEELDFAIKVEQNLPATWEELENAI